MGELPLSFLLIEGNTVIESELDIEDDEAHSHHSIHPCKGDSNSNEIDEAILVLEHSSRHRESATCIGHYTHDDRQLTTAISEVPMLASV